MYTQAIFCRLSRFPFLPYSFGAFGLLSLNMVICEIHITVAPETNEDAFITFCNDHKIKLIKAVSTKGDYPVEVMTNKYISCPSIASGIERVKSCPWISHPHDSKSYETNLRSVVGQKNCMMELT